MRANTIAILDGAELLAPGEEGILGLSISNAMHLSAWTDSTIDPQNLDEKLFCELLKKRVETSTFKKETANITLDVKGSH